MMEHCSACSGVWSQDTIRVCITCSKVFTSSLKSIISFCFTVSSDKSTSSETLSLVPIVIYLYWCYVNLKYPFPDGINSNRFWQDKVRLNHFGQGQNDERLRTIPDGTSQIKGIIAYFKFETQQ